LTVPVWLPGLAGVRLPASTFININLRGFVFQQYELKITAALSLLLLQMWRSNVHV
jgi:hypothetical protein